MTKLGDLKVGDKFRFADDRESTEEVLIDGPRKRGFDGQDEWSYWNANQGYRCSAHDSEVVPIREPEYRPYSDLRVLVGKVLKHKAQDEQVFIVVYATKEGVAVGCDGIYKTREADYVLDNYTHLDGTPGELVE